MNLGGHLEENNHEPTGSPLEKSLIGKEWDSYTKSEGNTRILFLKFNSTDIPRQMHRTSDRITLRTQQIRHRVIFCL